MGRSRKRPRFHFTSNTGWINDPHGIIYRDGEYDVFFQHVPGSTVWQPNCHWGHARGRDLMCLQELPIALAPGEGDDGIWSGSLLIDDDHRASIFYTATQIRDFGIGRIRTAWPSDPDWITWEKGSYGVDAPEGLDLIAFRDPFVRREGDLWRMFVGAAGRDGTAMALTYVSQHGTNSWRFDGVALARSTKETDPVWTGALWECPQIFQIEDRYAMVSSIWDDDNLHYVAYALGTYDSGRLRPETWGQLTYGPSYYAPSLFFDDLQRPCLSFWMRGIADPEAGWAGAHSVPHLLTLEGNRLVATPHPDIEKYHHELVGEAALDADEAVDVDWSPSPGDVLEVTRGASLLARVESQDAETRIVLGDREWTIPVGGSMRIIVDGPVLEVAAAGANFGTAIPTLGGGLAITSSGRAPQVRLLMEPAAPASRVGWQKEGGPR